MKKVLKITFIILEIIILLTLIFFIIDYSRVKNGQRPIFCIPHLGGTIKDGGTIEYFGLGYKVIDFHTIAGFDDIKIGTWFMDYDDFAEEMREYEIKYKDSMMPTTDAATAKAVVIRVYENSLAAMGIEGISENIFSVGFANEGDIGFKQGQEILIYYNGTIMTSYPARLGKVEKIEIIKEKSEVEIPEKYLKYYYNSRNNVTISIEEFESDRLGLTIVDTNELPYEYSTNYKIYKKVKNKDYTGVGYKIGEDTGNSIAGFTRNRS